jgi:hypothetical protein
VVVDPGGPIGDVDGDGLGELDRPLAARVERGLDRFRGPLRVIAQDPSGQVGGPLDPDATVAEGADRAVEQRPGRRVVEVDAEAVGEPELDPAEGVVLPWLLAELSVRQDLITVAPEIGPALPGFRPDLFRSNAPGHVPGRVEDHAFDGAADDRSPGVSAADDDPHVQDRPPLLDGVEAEGRDVDEDVTLSQVGRHPAPALQVHLDLPDLILRRPVQLSQGRRSGDPVHRKPVALLESADGLLQSGIEHLGELRFREGLGGLGLGCRREARTQGHDPFPFGA